MSRKTALNIFKALLAVTILVLIGRQFYLDLTSEQLSAITFHPGWLVASAALYLAGLSTWGLFWYRLMRLFDQQLTLPVAMRAYFLGQLGKYIPGKAWALLIRADQASGPGVVFGISIVTAFYEVLTSMAAGALLAAIVFFVEPPEFYGIQFPPYLTGLILLSCCGAPLLPGVFNMLAQRLAQKFPSLDAFQAPKLGLDVLLQGIALTSVGWLAMGLSVWACLASVIDPAPPLTLGSWFYYCAIVGLAYVLGFAAVVVPGGFGVREWVLKEFLQFVPGSTLASLAAGVLLLRLAWTAGEFVAGAALYALVRRKGKSS
ncbi:MAG: lysylphosphatidylglycerol synthase domain-containing protein [Planctomycetota bacterium]